MKFLLLFTLLASATFAGENSNEKKFLVKSVDGSDISSLKKPDLKILPPHRSIAYSSGLPSIDDRNRIFDQSGLGKLIENWDDFDKDSLFLKLKKKGPAPIERLLIKYPDLPRKSLEKAQELIAKEEK